MNEEDKKWNDPKIDIMTANGMTMTPKYYLLEMCMLAGILAFYVYFSSADTFTIHNLVLFLPCMGLVWASDALVYQLYLSREVTQSDTTYKGVPFQYKGKNDKF